MPRISEFYGIVISMYWNDHGLPHFHARYAAFEAVVLIETGMPLEGFLPARARRLVLEWVALHRGELWLNWELAREGRPLSPITPLA